MLKINKKNIPFEYNWFADKLDENFELILGNKSKVIFGFNGIGKSTLCDILKKLNNSNIEFLNYDQEGNSLINKKEIHLSYQIDAVSKLDEEIAEINNKLQISSQIKNNGITNVTIRKKIHPELEKYNKENRFPMFKSMKKDVINFLKKYQYLNFKSIFSYYNDLDKIVNMEDEIVKNNEQNIYKALELIKLSVDQNQLECPLCGTITDWKTALDMKMTKLSNIKSELIEKYKSKNISITIEELNLQLEAMKELKANQNLAFDVAITGSEEEYEKVENLLSKLKDKINEKNSLMAIAQSKFNLILNKKEYLENDLKRYFNIESKDVLYDYVNFVIIIKCPREIRKYSTGEINLLTFLYSIYSFLGSDKEILVLDDPVSSLDMINQYKIAFEIVKNISADKTMTVLTHSIDFLNIINSQYPKQFDFMYIEELNGVIYMDKIEYVDIKENPNIITLDKIRENDSEGLIEYLKYRDYDPSLDFEVLHYSNSEHFINGDQNKLSNYKLIKLIEDFKHLSHNDFYQNSYDKIKYLAAIRVWLEMKLFISIDSSDKDKQKEFLNQNTLEERISCILPRGKKININGKTITREHLMCKKVMLNQHIHFNSQIAPFSYAINLSLDDLQNEIYSIKDMFK